MSTNLPSSSTEEAVPWTPGDIAKGVVAAVIVVVVAVVITGLFVFGFRPGPGGRDLGGFILGIVTELALVGAAWRFSLRKYRRPWGALGFRSFGLGALWLVGLVLFLGLTVNIVYVALVSWVGLTNLLPPALPLEEEGLARVGTTLLAVVVSPVSEETFFRGFVFAGLKRRFGQGWGIGGSGLLFALAHFQASYIVPVSILGAMLAALYQSTGSIWPGILVHGLYNGLAVQTYFS